MKKLILSTAFAIATSASTLAIADEADGMIRVKSIHDVSTTINKLEAALAKKGMTIFKHVSHSDGAKKVGLKIRDTELLIFGNPKLGTLLMQCKQSAALDLPLKALAYKDEDDQVWLAYNDPNYIAKRHRISHCNQVTDKMSKALANFSKVATQ
ncbi:MAG: DUF302 domain-containing protein [Gammaproteobacteria bacterium]|nr:DUF302 domain-containing protein [Gammaproteobacteria bacterium]